MFDVVGVAFNLCRHERYWWRSHGLKEETLYTKDHKEGVLSCEGKLKLKRANNLGDIGVHLVELGVFGGLLPVLAGGHGVHDVLKVGKDKIVCLTMVLPWMRAR